MPVQAVGRLVSRAEFHAHRAAVEGKLVRLQAVSNHLIQVLLVGSFFHSFDPIPLGLVVVPSSRAFGPCCSLIDVIVSLVVYVDHSMWFLS